MRNSRDFAYMPDDPGSLSFGRGTIDYPDTVTLKFTVGDRTVERPVQCYLEADYTLSLNRLDIERHVHDAAQNRGGTRPSDVDVAPFRIEALRQIAGQEVTWSDIARRAGYIRENGSADTRRIKRDLGIKDAGKKTVRIDVADRLCEALALDPVDLGF